MLYPTLNKVEELLKEYQMVPVFYEVLADYIYRTGTVAETGDDDENTPIAGFGRRDFAFMDDVLPGQLNCSPTDFHHYSTRAWLFPYFSGVHAPLQKAKHSFP